MSTSKWFRVSITSRGATQVLSFAGELDAESAERIAEAADICLERGAPMILLDCTGVSFVDSTGLDAIRGVARRCRATGTGFRLAASPRVAKVAEMLDMDAELGLQERSVALEGLDALAPG